MRLNSEWWVFMTKYSLGKVVGFSGPELHGFWALGVMWVRCTVPRLAVSRSGHICRVGWCERFLLDFFFLGVGILVLRQEVVRWKSDSVVVHCRGLSLISLLVGSCHTAGYDYCDRVRGLGGMGRR